MNPPVVVDASAAVEIALRTAAGQRLVDHIRGRTPHVPDLFYVEAAAALRRMVNRSLLSAEAALAAVHHLYGWRARVAASRSLLFAAWTLRHNLTVTDAVYVVLARELDAVLVTGDRRLAAAPRLGVTVHTPEDPPK